MKNWELIRKGQHLRARGWKYRTAKGLKGWWLGAGPDAFFGGSLHRACALQMQREENMSHPNFMWGLDIATILGEQT